MPKTSSGLLLYRRRENIVEVLLVHPGGPFWRNTDLGSWTIPKGEVGDGEDLLTCAIREFEEELGSKPAGVFAGLPPIKQKGGKTVHAWTFEGDFDPSSFRSNTFAMEWPPRSGKQAEFAEIDRTAFFDLETAKRKINSAQVAFLSELEKMLCSSP